MVVQTLEKNLVIKKVSQNLLIDCIKTAPINPKYATLTFLADGIETPWPREEKEEEKYISKCKEKNIIPFSKLELKYSVRHKGFSPKDEEVVYSGDFSTLRNDTTIDGLINGGRFNEIRVGCSLLGELKKQLLPSLLKNNYQISDGRLEFATVNLGGYHVGDFEDSYLILKDIGGKVTLHIGEKLGEKDVKLVVPWFKELKEKYEPSAQLKLKV